jgi:hypothetical protein
MWAAQKMVRLEAGARIFQRPEMYHAPSPPNFWLAYMAWQHWTMAPFTIHFCGPDPFHL